MTTFRKEQDLGFTLKEIKNILYVYKKENYFPIEDMYQFAAIKIQEIEEKINHLNKLAKVEIFTAGRAGFAASTAATSYASRSAFAIRPGSHPAAYTSIVSSPQARPAWRHRRRPRFGFAPGDRYLTMLSLM